MELAGGASVPSPARLDAIGDVIIGLTPAVSISEEPRGMPVPDVGFLIPPPKRDDVPDAVLAGVPEPQDPDKLNVAEPCPETDEPEPMEPVLRPAASKVEVGAVVPFSPEPDKPELDIPELETPVPKQRLLLAVGSNGAGLMPPGESSVAPIGIPTGPTEDPIPGIPSGEVVPIA